MELTPRFLVVPDGSSLLLGLRGTGKTTRLMHLFPDSLRIDLLKPDVYRELSARPERLAALAAGTPPGSTIVVDEVQRVPLAWIACSRRNADLFYWATPGGLEVDFVIYGDAGFWAIEVKNTNRVRPEDLPALRAIKQDYPEVETRLLYRGSERLLIDSILCVPVDQYLVALRPDGNP
jgi:predicted AAA+ superfamily ATPase